MSAEADNRCSADYEQRSTEWTNSRVHPPLTDLHEGPMFLLAERLTGITLTRQLIKESAYLCGVVPEPLSTDIPWPW
jgi:uncharacterized protein DUF6461